MPLTGFLASQRGRTGSQSQCKPLGVDIAHRLALSCRGGCMIRGSLWKQEESHGPVIFRDDVR